MTTTIEKPKITDLRDGLERFVSANVMTRLESLAEALQWYDKAFEYLTDKGRIDKKHLDPKTGIFGKMNKLRGLGVSSIYPEEKENALIRTVRLYQTICEEINPIVNKTTGRRQADIDDYYDEYKKKKQELEEEEKRAQAKYQPVLDFLNTVFGNLGFKISIDPNATKYKQFSGPDTNEITYSSKAARDVYDTLRKEGMLAAFKKELFLFSRAKAMDKDSNGQWEIHYDTQIKVMEKMFDEFINYARLDIGKWKLMRYGSVAQASTQQQPVQQAAPKPSTPKPAKQKKQSAGGSHIGDYAPGTPMHTIFTRLSDGKFWSKKDLYDGLGKVAWALAWVKIHGEKSGKWKVNDVRDGYQMVMS